MLPWFDLALAALLVFVAWRGYRRGFIGGLRRLIGLVAGLFFAWIGTPIAVAWLQSTFKIIDKTASAMKKSLPEDVRLVLAQLSEAVESLQALHNQVLSLPWPEKMLPHIEKAIEETAPTWYEGMQAQALVDQMMNHFAQNVVTGVTFVIIFICLSLFVRNFLGFFSAGQGHGLFSTADGLFGLMASVAIEVILLTLLIGALYPGAMLNDGKDGFEFLYKGIRDSQSAPYFYSYYQAYIQPLLK